MAIDFEREAQLHRENLEDLESQHHRASQNHGAQAPAFIQTATAIRNQLPSSSDDPTSVAQAARRGFADGFTQQLSPVSPLGALAHVAEAAEQGVAGGPEGHLDRFPELRDVEMATGNAARFPELAETTAHPVRDEIEDDGFGR